MRSDLDLAPSPFLLPGRLALETVVVYEDFATACHARRASAEWLQQAGRQVKISHTMWKFNLLQNHKLKEMAADDAAAADLVIIAAQEDKDLPDEVKSWINLWMERPLGRGAILLVVAERPGEHHESAGPACAYLRQVAQRGNLDFIAAGES